MILFGSLFTASAQAYSIYGTATFAGSYPDSVVNNARINVYKDLGGGQWQYHGSTTASACGYYTYGTGESGTFKAVVVQDDYDLRSLSSCGSVTDNVNAEGYGIGTVTWLNPEIVVNIPCD